MTRAGTAAAITAAAVAAGAASLTYACSSPRPADRAVATCRRAVLRRLGEGAALHNLHVDDRGATLYGTVESHDQRGTPVSATFTCTVRGAAAAVDVQPWIDACLPVNVYGDDCRSDQPPAPSDPAAANG